jgi:hypothetical protein
VVVTFIKFKGPLTPLFVLPARVGFNANPV